MTAELVPDHETTDERAARVERLHDWLTTIARHEAEADSHSMARAADLVALYEDLRWVDEAPPVAARDAIGRPSVPTSFSRFASHWLPGRIPMHKSRAYQLRDAHVLAATYFHGVEISREWPLRPLVALERKGWGEIVPTLWSRATEAAGGPEPTREQVGTEIARWKKEIGPRRFQSKVKESAVQRQIRKTDADLELLWRMDRAAAIDTVNKFVERHEQSGGDGE